MSEQKKLDAERAAFEAWFETPEAYKAGDSNGWRGIAWAAWQKARSLPVGVPDGYALVKIGTGCVTSEMKAACIGEFSFGVSMACAECVDVGADEDCPVCGGQIEYTQHIDVPWDTCKEIYKAMLAAAPTAKAEQVQCRTCNGTRMVDDGVITRSEGGMPFENGPVKCVKDCPDCAAPSLPAAGSAVEERIFRKKPVTIEAVQWRGDNIFEVIEFTDGDTDINGNFAEMMWEQYCDLVAQDGFKIKTLEGTMTASVGDWIIKGIKGEFYPCKPDIFLATYEPVSNQEAISSLRPEQHPDDAAVDSFAAAMKSKLAKSREKGRHGWQTASAAHLSSLLYHHIYKADPLDVANLAMMLHQNGQAIELPYEARRPADQQSAPDRVSVPVLSDKEREDLLEFHEAVCCDAGHRVDKEGMRRLAEIGAVQPVGFGRHRLTEFGVALLASHGRGEA